MNESTKKSRKKSKNTKSQMKMKTQWSKVFGIHQSCSKREVYSNTGLLQEEKSQIKNLTLHLKEVEKPVERRK